MQNVHVQFGFSPRAQAHLGFAAGLAHRLGATLFVWTHRDGAATTLLEKRASQLCVEREDVDVRARVGCAVGLIAPELKPRFAQGNPAQNVSDRQSVLVGDHAFQPRSGAALISPMRERAFDARGLGEICLPFGNGESALDGAMQTLGFAARLKLPVLLYHTTWRESGLPETAPPEAHMDPKVREVRGKLRQEADKLRIPHRDLIETAATVAEGICRVALNERCAMIAMSRGRHVGRGSYVDGVLARTPVPVFLAGRSA